MKGHVKAIPRNGESVKSLCVASFIAYQLPSVEKIIRKLVQHENFENPLAEKLQRMLLNSNPFTTATSISAQYHFLKMREATREH